MQVIPTVNAPNLEEATRQFEVIKSFLPSGNWIQIDVVDGIFSPKKTWGDPEEFKNLKTQIADLQSYHFEIHLMVQESGKAADEWLAAGADRIIVHLESKIEPFLVLGRCNLNNREAMVAVTLETPINKLESYFPCVYFFQILAVSPGPAGQKFDIKVLDKIRELRAKVPNAKIEVDGGITPEIARQVKEAGADMIVSASYVLNSSDPKRAYEELSGI